VAIVGSDVVKDQAAGELDVGDAKVTDFVDPMLRSVAKSVKPPIDVFGATAAIVTFIDVDVEPNPPAGACRAVIVEVPALRAIRVCPSSPITDGSELEKVQVPRELEVGVLSCTRETLSIARVISLNVPRVGAGALMVNVIVRVDDNQRPVGACVALI
jgi:hypothetical protein